MVASYTANARLQKPATSDRNWDVPLNANADLLDGMTAVGGLAVAPKETPSVTLNVQVAAGGYKKADGTMGAFAGAPSVALPASATTYLWLTDAGALTTGNAFPTTAHVRLAHAVTSTSSISSVVDERVQSSTAGTGLGFVLKTGDSFADGASFSFGTTTGTQLATSPSQKLGFFGVTPATQAATVASLSDSTNGTVGTGVTDVGATFNQQAINANLATVAARINSLIAALKRHGLMSS